MKNLEVFYVRLVIVHGTILFFMLSILIHSIPRATIASLYMYPRSTGIINYYSLRLGTMTSLPNTQSRLTQLYTPPVSHGSLG